MALCKAWARDSLQKYCHPLQEKNSCCSQTYWGCHSDPLLAVISMSADTHSTEASHNNYKAHSPAWGTRAGMQVWQTTLSWFLHQTVPTEAEKVDTHMKVLQVFMPEGSQTAYKLPHTVSGAPKIKKTCEKVLQYFTKPRAITWVIPALVIWTLKNDHWLCKESMSLKNAVLLQADIWIQMMFSGPKLIHVPAPSSESRRKKRPKQLGYS